MTKEQQITLKEKMVSMFDLAIKENLESYQIKKWGEKFYKYSKGNISNTYTAFDTSFCWLNAKNKTIAKELNIDIHLNVSLKFSEFISNPINAEKHYITIGVSGKEYINYYKCMEVTSKTTQKQINSFFKKSIKDLQKETAKGLVNDIKEKILPFLKAIKSDYQQTGSTDIGYGSCASVHIHKKYQKVYNIKNIDKLLNLTKELVEKEIKNSSMFKKDNVQFDWKKGIMFTQGKYTEVWD